MLLKFVSFVLLLQIAAISASHEKFMIKNKQTGMVLDGNQNPIGIGPWENRNSQLWTLESSSDGRYFLHNVGNGKVLDACPQTKAVLTWQKHSGTNQKWSLNPSDDNTRLEVQFYPNHFMVHKVGKAQLYGSKQNDDSDMWLLVDVV